jgi:uncharacterized protein (DUF433 family)
MENDKVLLAVWGVGWFTNFEIFTMSVLEQKLLSEVESVPEFLKQEVLDFVLFLKEKHLKKGISKTPGVCGGEACVEGTRLAVWMLVEARRAGCTDEEILQDYPGLNSERLSSALAYAEAHSEEIERAMFENAQV